MNLRMGSSLLALTLGGSLSGALEAQAVPQVASPDAYGDIADYQMGSAWGKSAVFESNLLEKSAAFQRTAKATGYIEVGGTGFYLGMYGDQHIVATNHHVCPKAGDCEGKKIQFRLFHRTYKIKKFLQTLPQVDLTLLSIDVPESDEIALRRVGRMFAFGQHVYPGEPLITIGFGVGGNSNNYLMGTADSDCKVFSEKGEYRLLRDPDRLGPVTYRAWSFAHACDISHGDSGSAMVDRRNGAVVGILWTGRIPKLKRMQSSEYLNTVLKRSRHPDIWSEFNYAVPSVKIGEVLYEQSHNPAVPPKLQKTYLQMLAAGRGIHESAN